MAKIQVIDPELLKILACPICKSDIKLVNEKLACVNRKCKATYSIEDKIPIMLPSDHWANKTNIQSKTTEEIVDDITRRNEHIMRRKYHRFLISSVISAIGQVNGRILDVGCGYGNHTKLLESRGTSIVGIDIQNIGRVSRLSKV
jgi:hypothetical protein